MTSEGNCASHTFEDYDDPRYGLEEHHRDALARELTAAAGVPMRDRYGLTTTAAGCPHGDPTCPCPDGDACHYRDYPAIEGRWPVSKAMVCTSPDCTVKEPHERAVSPGWNDDLLDEVHTW